VKPDPDGPPGAVKAEDAAEADPEPGAFTIELDLAAPSDGVERALFGGRSSSEGESDGGEEWEEVAPGGAAAAGGAGKGAARGSLAKQPADWLGRMAQRQKFWSTSHGFRMGRKLGAWGEGEEEGAAAAAAAAEAGAGAGADEVVGAGEGSGAAAAGAAAAGAAAAGDEEDGQLQEAIRLSLLEPGGGRCCWREGAHCPA
jgi:hypothetical protein